MSPRLPSAERIAEIKAGIVTPNPLERRYLAALDRGLSEADAAQEAFEAAPVASARSPLSVDETPRVSVPAKLPKAEQQQEAPAPPAVQSLVPPLDTTRPWYRPDPRHLTSARRAVMPAIWLTIAVLAFQGSLAAFGLLTPTEVLSVQVQVAIVAAVTLVMGLLMWSAYRGSYIAAFIALALHGSPAGRAILEGFENFTISLAFVIALNIILVAFWAIAATTLQQYRKFLKEAAAHSDATSPA
ncbi:hypothetical protein [Maricaulis alexandrii]|uniref:hypothetical protein n=1 Tax=Maricaulis alexandrii TaxID=2570354 RepID=UPI00110998B3|nr:hypothetical protein [Maricaulis alexandrii]